jgi:HlyD family secretion protein
MTRILLSMLAVVALVAALAAANWRRDPGAPTLEWQLIRTPAREVVLERPTKGAIVQTVTAPGAVELVDEAQIASQIVGRVIEVPVKDGDRVKKGDLLVRLDSTDAMAQRDSALARIERLRGAILQAQTDQDKARRDLNRTTDLANRGMVTPTELADAKTFADKARGAMAMATNELAESQAALKTAEEFLRRTEIRAPIDGVIAGLDVEVGEVVIAGTTNLPGTVMMTIGDLAFMRARADVDETDVPLVRPGQPVKIFLQADPTRPIPGEVELVASKGKKTEEVVSFETLVRVPRVADTPLRPGMTATIQIEVKRADGAVGVPVQAVLQRRRKDLPDTPALRSWVERNASAPGEKASEADSRYVKIVFVVEKGVARARPVETGLSDERRVEILSGIGPEESLITGPFRALDELKDGDPVAVLPPGAAPTKGR